MLDLDSNLSTVKDYLKRSETSAPDGWTGLYMDHPEAKVRLSHSSFELLHGCERKFQLTKLLKNERLREESPAMSFGKGVGAAWQAYFVLRSQGHSKADALASAEYTCWVEYHPLLEDDKRFLERALSIVKSSTPFLERMLEDWEVAYLNGRPAYELGFNLNIDAKFHYVGYVDLVVRNRRSGRFAIVDIKTTSLGGEDLSPIYKFSDQCLGYSIVLDKIAGEGLADYDVMYWVCQLPWNKGDLYSPRLTEYVFPKTLKDRFDWFLKVYLDISYLRNLEELDAYPKRGGNCRAYNRTCTFFNECQFTASDTPALYIPDSTAYDFTYELSEILDDHMNRLRNAA